MNIRHLLLGITRNLSHTQRYSSAPVIRPENVAEHSFFVAYYSLELGLHLEEQGRVINIGDLLARGLLHDIGEAVTGDIMRPFKYANSRVLEAINDTEKLLVHDRLHPYIYGYWLSAKDETIEGQIVAFADALCVIAYCYEEWKSGNRHVQEIVRVSWKHLLSHTDQPEFYEFKGPLTEILKEINGGVMP